MKFAKPDPEIIASFLISILLLSQFAAVLPYLDGNIDFVQTHDFYTGGLAKYFENWNSVHPPGKLVISSIFYDLIGFGTTAYSLIGIVFSLVAIVSIFNINKEIFNKTIARVSALLLSSSGLFISTGIFALRDFLLTSLVLLSLNLYLKKKYLLYAFASGLAVAVKETGLLLVFSVLLVEVYYWLRDKGRFTKTASLFLPAILSAFWFLFLDFNDKKPWADWLFTDTARFGTIYTIINNLLTFNFLNKYALQNWLQLLVLNFNWVHTIIIALGIVYLLAKKSSILKSFFFLDRVKQKVVISSLIFCLSYGLTVLTLQTFTIPRYGLPVVPFILTVSCASLYLLFKKKLYYLSALTVFIPAVLISLFFSVDPVSTKLWGKTKILGENLYALNLHLAGSDGITYNIQYARVAKKRSEKILSEAKARGYLVSNECHFIFPDPNNDYKTAKILKININLDKPCRSNQ